MRSIVSLAHSTISTRWIIETIRGAEVEVPEVDIGRGYWSWSYESLLQLSDDDVEAALQELRKDIVERLLELLPVTMAAIIVASGAAIYIGGLSDGYK